MTIGLVVLAALSAPAQSAPVWSDEFEGAALDAAKWQAPEMNRQGDQSRWSPRQVRVAEGMLRLAAVPTGAKEGPRFECGAVRTRPDYDPSRTYFQHGYGSYEIRARLPKNLRSDVWFAFWIMAGDISDNQTDTRKGSEIDIVETFHAWDGRLGHNINWGGYGATHNSFGAPSGRLPAVMDGQFHTYGLRWTPAGYWFLFDRRVVAFTNALGLGESGKPKSQGTCREPGYIKLSLEAAHWAGPSNDWEPNPEPDEALVDYIRVYGPQPPVMVAKRLSKTIPGAPFPKICR